MESLSICHHYNCRVIVTFDVFQLSQVDTAIQAAGTESNSDLVKLKADLQELIMLTEGKISHDTALSPFYSSV